MASVGRLVFSLVVAVIAHAWQVAGQLPFEPYALWATDVHYPTGTPVLSGSYLYTAVHSNGDRGYAPFSVVALDAATGVIKFNVSAIPPMRDPKGSVAYAGPTGKPSSEARVAYSFEDASTVWAVNALTGSSEWSVSLSDRFNYVSAWRDRFFVAVRSGILCLNASNGAQLWTHSSGPGRAGIGRISVSDDRVAVTISNGEVVGIDVLTGGVLYSTRASPDNYVNNFYGWATVAGGVISAQGLATDESFTSNNATVAAFRADNGATIFQAIYAGDEVGTTAPGGGADGVTVFVPYLNIAKPYTAIHAYDSFNSGQLLWSASDYYYVHSVVLAAHTTCATVTVNEMDFTNKLIGFDSKSGSVKWTVPSPFSQRVPLQAAGTVYGSGGDYASPTTVTALLVEQSQ